VGVGGDHSITGTCAKPGGADRRLTRPRQAADRNRQPAGRQQTASHHRPGSTGNDLDRDADGDPLPSVPAARVPESDQAPAPGSGADEHAFREYVRARRRALLRMAYLLTGNLADAEDLVQSALAKTYLAWDRIEDRRALDGYVRRAMVNTQISWWRKRRLDEFPTDELPDQAAVDQSISSDMQEALRRAIDRLPERMRAAVTLRYYEDMTEAEIAEVLGVSLGTVKSTVSRAVAKLRIDVELQPD
jgi:RNA polymerase sigma-70 factor (sigma-E family)